MALLLLISSMKMITRLLSEQFTHHNIEIACSLVECCGRYLFRSADTHLKTNHLLVRTRDLSSGLFLISESDQYCNPVFDLLDDGSGWSLGSGTKRAWQSCGERFHDFLERITLFSLNRWKC